MTDYQSFALTLLSSAGVSVALSGAAIWLARSWISERLKASIKHEYDQSLATLTAQLSAKNESQLEALRADIDRHAEKLRIASMSITEVQKAAIARKLDGIDTLWTGIVSARALSPVVLGFMDLLTPDEYVGARDHQTFKNLTADLTVEGIGQLNERARGSLETTRPYIGEYTWALFATLNAVVFRIVYLVSQGKTDPEKLNWHRDNGVRGLIRSGLGDDGVATFDRVPIGRISWIREQFEGRILSAMEKLITGKEFGESALLQAQRMEEQLRKLTTSNTGG